MFWRNLHILLIFTSLILIFMGMNMLLPEKPSSLNSFEFEHIIHKELHQNVLNLKNTHSYISDIFSDHLSTSRWILIFISAASNCGNSLNEINDY